jgi:hypothetical protein
MATERPVIVLNMAPVAFSPETFQQAFGIGHSKFYEEIKAGRLVARKLGTRTIILSQDAKAWAQALPPIEKPKPYVAKPWVPYPYQRRRARLAQPIELDNPNDRDRGHEYSLGETEE